MQEDGGVGGARFQGREAFKTGPLKLTPQGNVPGKEAVQGAPFCCAPRATLSVLPFLSSGKHTQTPTSKTSVFFLPRHLAYDQNFLSPSVLTYHQPLKFCRHVASKASQGVHRQAHASVVYCGFLAGKASPMRKFLLAFTVLGPDQSQQTLLSSRSITEQTIQRCCSSEDLGTDPWQWHWLFLIHLSLG